MADDQLITLTADIVSAHVANNSVAVGDVANLVQQVHAALSKVGETAAAPEPQAKVPAVSVRSSVKPDYIVCMECGSKQKMLKRHLQTAHSMGPDQYRQEYGLPKDYPMVAPNYSEQRRTLAHSIGLGRKREEGAKPKRTRKIKANPTQPTPPE
jgi:predicted transcriptional regulator